MLKVSIKIKIKRKQKSSQELENQHIIMREKHSQDLVNRKPMDCMSSKFTRYYMDYGHIDRLNMKLKEDVQRLMNERYVDVQPQMEQIEQMAFRKFMKYEL